MIDITVLSVPLCLSCKEVKESLKKLKNEFKMNIKEIDITKNQKILEQYPVMSSPGLVINGKLVSQGIVSEKKLRALLEKASAN